jgi:hypothetical protein
MRDYLFFPIAALVAGLFVFVALEPYAERLPSGPVSGGGRNAQDVTVSGDELNRIILGETAGSTLDLIRPDGGAAFLRIDRQAGGKYEDPRLGPHLVLAEDLEYALESRPIEVVIEARSVGDFAASQFEANYFAKVEGESGWREFTLTREFQPYTLTFHTPRRGREEGYDYIGIRPVTPDKHRVMDVRSIRVRVAGNKATPPTTQTTGPMP